MLSFQQHNRPKINIRSRFWGGIAIVARKFIDFPLPHYWILLCGAFCLLPLVSYAGLSASPKIVQFKSKLENFQTKRNFFFVNSGKVLPRSPFYNCSIFRMLLRWFVCLCACSFASSLETINCLGREQRRNHRERLKIHQTSSSLISWN